MHIFEVIVIFLFGCFVGGLVGYMMCIKSWIKEISNHLILLEIEQAKIKAELEAEDENDN